MPVYRFLQRVQRQELERGLNRLLGPPGRRVLLQQSGKRARGQLAQPAPLAREPFLEPHLAQAKPCQKLAAVQVGRLIQGRGRTLGDQPLEPVGIHLGRRRVQSDAAGVDHDQRARSGVGGDPADREQRLAEAVAGLRLAALTPEQGSQGFAPVRLSRRESQIGKQGLRLTGRQAQLGSCRHEAKAAEEIELEMYHDAQERGGPRSQSRGRWRPS